MMIATHAPRWLLASALTLAVLPAAHASDVTTISKIRAATLELYEAPNMEAPRREVAVPASLGDWAVTGAFQQFYKVQAGSAGEGWARRSLITVVPGGPAIPACAVDPTSNTYKPTGSTAGISRKSC